MRYIIQVTFLICAVLFVSSTAQAVCAKKTTLQDLSDTSRAGEKAFADMDLQSLLVHSTGLRDDILPCLTEKLTPQTAAYFHRMMALEGFTKSNNDRVVREFHAARRLDPGYEIPLDVAGANHPLRKLYEQSLMVQDGTLEVVYPPKDGYITVGGVRNAPRPNMTPVIIQVFGPMDVLIETRYLQPGQTLPVWGVDPHAIGANVVIQPSVFSKPKTWYYTAAVFAVIGGSLYAVAMHEKSKFNNTDNKDTPESDNALLDHKDNANTLGTLSLVSGGFMLASTGVGVGLKFFFTEDEKSSKGVSK